MSAITRVGDRMPDRDPADRISMFSLELKPLDLIVQWRRCSITADFLADYLVYLFENRPNAQHILSTGLNELVENLAKFSADKRASVTLSVAHYGEHLRVETVNVARRPQVEALSARLNRMATEDPEDLFLEQLEYTASSDRAASGLGLITIKKDYGARLGAVLEPVEGSDDLTRITFLLELDVDAVEQA